MSMDIHTLLNNYNNNMLWEMARDANLPETTGKKLKKDELLLLMKREFFRPERIKASYQRLTELERVVLNRLLLHDGQVATRIFKRELLQVGLVTEAPPKPPQKGMERYAQSEGWSMYGRTVTHIGQPHDAKSTIFEDVIARLTLRGLVFSEESVHIGGQPFKLQYHPASKLIIPVFLRQYLPEPVPVNTEDWQPAHVLHGDPQVFLRDLYLYWDVVRRTPVYLIKSGLVSKRSLKQLNDNLLMPDPTLATAKSEEETDRLFLLRQVLEALKLIKPQRDDLLVARENGRSIPQFWRNSVAEQVQDIIAVWRTLHHPFQLDNKYIHYTYTPDSQAAIQHLLDVLGEMPAQTWVETDMLLDFLREKQVDFLISGRSRIENQRSSYYYGNVADLVEKMNRLERVFVTRVMAAYLWQMGLVELGFDAVQTDPTTWKAFRLTPLGTAVFRHGTLETTPATGQIIVQPNFQILAMGPVPFDLLAQLDLFAERKKVDRSAFEYHLSRESVYAAQQMGYSVAEVEQFLTTVTTNNLPQNIQRSLAEWAAHHERIVFRSGVTLLQTADEALLVRLLNDEHIGKLLARPVADSVALVKNKRQTPLLQALQSAGIFPVVSGANPEAADKSVVVHENGRIQSVYVVPSLHLRGRLARFTEEVEDGWQLTETAVSRAGGSQKKAQRIIDELRKLHRGQLPQVIVEQVKAWGGYYGAATVGTMTLFEFRDQGILSELCHLPELHDLLRPFPAGNRALAVVEAESVTAVQAILTRLGVKITPLPNA
ncbi:MAG: helicase-associated domain-containing protein [Chloroflexota bacterium]